MFYDFDNESIGVNELFFTPEKFIELRFRDSDPDLSILKSIEDSQSKLATILQDLVSEFRPIIKNEALLEDIERLAAHCLTTKYTILPNQVNKIGKRQFLLDALRRSESVINYAVAV